MNWPTKYSTKMFKDQMISFRPVLACKINAKWSRSKWSYPGYTASCIGMCNVFVSLIKLLLHTCQTYNKIH